jgi:hypothetical protein
MVAKRTAGRKSITGVSEGADWNVLTSPWLEVMGVDATPGVCSPVDALATAAIIRCVTSPSPLDLFAAYRFLLTLLYWKSTEAGGVEEIRKSLLRSKVPRPVLAAIKAESHRFELFANESPFLQEQEASDEKAEKSAGSLFAEFACGTNIAHFHHGDDERMRLCLPCATIGMLRIVPWSQSGGAGLSPAVHNAPPIVAIALGENLAITLGLNLVGLGGEAGEARWSGHLNPSHRDKPIPYMEAFTWNPRRVHLRSVETNGLCWRCGRPVQQVVGRIVYAKNENTKLNKKGAKTIPFIWQDPSAFYRSDTPYITIKSYDEVLARDGRDLAGLIGQDGSQPVSMVLKDNPAHEGWRLVIPCTNPANNKTYDHRQIELANLSADALRALVPAAPLPWRQRGVDGWTERRTASPANGAKAFVRSAVRLLTHADWAVLASAVYRQMHESPAAFDLLSGLLWALRDRKAPGLPSRNVAWLLLKLMGAAPSHARLLCHNARFCPLDMLPKRQLEQRRGKRDPLSLYPVSMPGGQRLEAALRDAIDRHLRQRNPAPIDWPSLCYRLGRLLD